MFWHINNFRLALADKRGYLQVYQLRNQGNVAMEVEHSLNVSEIHPDLKPTDIVGFWILEDGDILVQTYSTRDTTSASSSSRPKLAANPGLLTRLTPSVPGLIVWALSDQSNFCGNVCTHDSSKGDAHARPIYAVGKTEIYEIRHERQHESQSFRWVSTLIVRRLDQPFQGCTIRRYEHWGYRNWNDCHITLTGDEKFLILKNRKGVLGTVSTVNGYAQTIGGNFWTQASVKIATSCIVGTSSSGFCEYRSRFRSTPGQFACSVFKYDYDVPSASFVRKEIYKKHKPNADLDGIHDCDRGITFSSKRRVFDNCKDVKRNGEYMSFRVHETRDNQPISGAVSPGVRDMNLKAPKDGRRRYFRLRSPEKLRDLPLTNSQSSGPVSCSDSFMGMIDGYFINYNCTLGDIAVFGFWPSW